MPNPYNSHQRARFMTQRTRYFLLGSVVVIIVGLATGLVAIYNGNLPLRGLDGRARRVGLPAGRARPPWPTPTCTTIMNSEFRQKLRQVLPTGEEKDKLQAEIGVDIEHDIDTVVAGFAGASATTRAPSRSCAAGSTRRRSRRSPSSTAPPSADYNGKRLICDATRIGAAAAGRPSRRRRVPRARLAGARRRDDRPGARLTPRRAARTSPRTPS